MKRSGLVIFATILVLASCTHEPANIIPGTGGGGTGGGTGGGGNTSICFESDVLPIFQSSCAKSGCHDAASRQGGYILTDYANIIRKGIRPGNAGGSKIFQVIVTTDPGDRMPQPPNPALTTAQINLIGEWINEGALNTSNCGNTCDTSLFTYSGAVKITLQNNCYGCHNAATANAGLNLTDYTVVKTNVLNGRIQGSVKHTAGYVAMPQGSPKLSDCKIKQIDKWAQAGAPNN
jgi:hypothetical protein